MERLPERRTSVDVSKTQAGFAGEEGKPNTNGQARQGGAPTSKNQPGAVGRGGASKRSRAESLPPFTDANSFCSIVVRSPPMVVSTPPRLTRISPALAPSALKLASVCGRSLFSESATSTMLFESAGCSSVRTLSWPSLSETRTFLPPKSDTLSRTTTELVGRTE